MTKGPSTNLQQFLSDRSPIIVLPWHCSVLCWILQLWNIYWYQDDWKIAEIQSNLHNLGSLIRKGNFIKIGCLEEPKPTYPSLLWLAEWKFLVPLVTEYNWRLWSNDQNYSTYHNAMHSFRHCSFFSIRVT